MNKVFCLALLAGGVGLIVIGVNVTTLFYSDIFRAFTGSPTDKAVWMLIAGVASAALGLGLALRPSKRKFVNQTAPSRPGTEASKGSI